MRLIVVGIAEQPEAGVDGFKAYFSKFKKLFNVEIEIKILWAVSSVGKGHVMRDLAIVNQLRKMADVDIDWLAPDPAGDFLRSRGQKVLEYSDQLAGSGKIYEQVFSESTEEFNLLRYTRADTRLHKHDFNISSTAWQEKPYDVIVGDEAFWLLTGFASRWDKKPAPFIFMTDFIGTKAMRSNLKDHFTAWMNNLRFSFSHRGPDVYLYIGNAEEIPDDNLGFLLPGRRKWAQKHCRFVRPIIGFDPNALPGQPELRTKLNLPDSGKIFLATIGPEGKHEQRRAIMEEVFENLKLEYPGAYFIITGSKTGTKKWIHYFQFLDNLYQYFAASDFVITQSGYGKVTELVALGTPFIAIPLDHHFEQEYVMRHRLDHYGMGRLITLRDNSPNGIARMAHEMMNKEQATVEVDTGMEVANLILNLAESSNGDKNAL